MSRLLVPAFAATQLLAALLKNFVDYSSDPFRQFLHDIAILSLQATQLATNVAASWLSFREFRDVNALTRITFLFAGVISFLMSASEGVRYLQLLLEQHRDDYINEFQGWSILFFIFPGFPMLLPLCVAVVRSLRMPAPTAEELRSVGVTTDTVILLSLTAVTLLLFCVSAFEMLWEVYGRHSGNGEGVTEYGDNAVVGYMVIGTLWTLVVVVFALSVWVAVQPRRRVLLLGLLVIVPAGFTGIAN